VLQHQADDGFGKYKQTERGGNREECSQCDAATDAVGECGVIAVGSKSG